MSPAVSSERAAGTAISAGTSAPAATPSDSYRLPTTVVPRRYELHLVPDLAAATFQGTERIEVEVTERVDAVVCHAEGLAIGSATLASGWSSEQDKRSEPDKQNEQDKPGGQSPLAVELDPRTARVRFLPQGPQGSIEPGRYTLSCAFSGVLDDRLRGFYRSTFLDRSGEQAVIATTQFEETSARKAFPCFDEPDRKAVFSITLDAPAGAIALSNGAEIAVEELAGGRRRVRFGDTIPMSTYLVAFVVGPLELSDVRQLGRVPVRIAYPPGRGRLLAPAFEATEHALGFFADYFGLDYPSDKLDLVALPDFAAGAMENLGCVTFREALLLADPEHTSRVELERLAEVVEHELAHMWFGDLVTMRWWNGIWLNEAFATFMSLCCQDDYRPQWEVFTSFARGREAAFGIDALHSTRPIEYPVREPEDAAAMFDVLTYEKGASVLWMIERYLGGERFRSGVREYLATHAYGNTETTDLWDALGAAAPEVPVRSVMESWLLQGGYPLVTARSVPGGEEVELSQEPFSYLPATVAAEIGTAPEGGSAIGSGWLVPILVRTAGPGEGAPAAAGEGAPADGGEPGRVLLGDEPVRVPRAASGGALVLNAYGTGFYRLSYDAALRGKLLDHLDGLTALERFNLLSDTWATTLAGRSELAELVELARRLADDANPHVWWLLADALGQLDLVAGDDERPAVRAYARSLLVPQLRRVGWRRRADEDEQTPLLRSTLVAGLGTVGGDEEVVAQARELFAEDHFAGKRIDPDLSSAVLGVVAAHASPEELAASLERFRHPIDPMDGIRHLYSLARLRHLDQVDEVLALTLGDIRSQNAPVLLGGLLANRYAGPRTFAFVQQHWPEMRRRFPDNLLPRMLEGVSGLAQLDAEGRPLFAAAVRAFCREAVTGARRRLVEQSLERLEVNVRLAQAVRGRLAAILGS